MHPELSHKDFFTAVAAILPILFLAISIQSSSFVRDPAFSSHDGPYKFTYAATTSTLLIALGVCEWLVLRTLYTGQDNYASLIGLTLIMVLSVIYIVLDFLLNLYQKNNLTGLFGLIIISAGVIIFMQAKYLLR